MANEISLSLDLIIVKDGNNFYVGVLKPCVCPYAAIQPYWNFKLCFYFFQNLRFQIWGAAYLQMRLIHGRSTYTVHKRHFPGFLVPFVIYLTVLDAFFLVSEVPVDNVETQSANHKYW